MSSAQPDEEVLENWESFQYRRMMGISVAEYEQTPAIVVDWDLALATTEDRVKADLKRKAAKAHE